VGLVALLGDCHQTSLNRRKGRGVKSGAQGFFKWWAHVWQQAQGAATLHLKQRISELTFQRT